MSKLHGTRPFSIRLTDAEKASLRQKAGGMPLGAYVRQVTLGTTEIRRKAPVYPVKDSVMIGQILGLLGQSRLANNLNQLAKAANLGNLPVTEETEADLIEACAAVAEIRSLLLVALGLKSFDIPSDGSLTDAFAENARGDAP